MHIVFTSLVRNVRLACYHSVQNTLSFSSLSNIVKIKIHKSVIVLFYCTGVKLGLVH
jgi:hypothetical protein